MATSLIRVRVNELSLDRFHALLQARWGVEFGASMSPDGARRIWRDQHNRRQFVTADSWSEALWCAWLKWQMPVDGMMCENADIIHVSDLSELSTHC